MKHILSVALLSASLLSVNVVTAPEAQAVGCLSGAFVGGAAGHVAGHHGLLGAAAGCAVGHHMAVRRNREARQQQQDQQSPTPTSAQPGSQQPNRFQE